MHDCQHETDIALMKQAVENIEKAVEKNNDITIEIHKLLSGNGGIGLKTKIALLEQGQKKMWLLISSLLAAGGGAGAMVAKTLLP